MKMEPLTDEEIWVAFKNETQLYKVTLAKIVKLPNPPYPGSRSRFLGQHGNGMIFDNYWAAHAFRLKTIQWISDMRNYQDIIKADKG